jgi:hypothetical protein
MEPIEKPVPFTNSDLHIEYWFNELVKEQRKTNELLESLLDSKPKATRKKKGDEEK